jgi:peroxiredoxin Q/BCP
MEYNNMIRTTEHLPYFSLYNQNNKLRKNDDYFNKWLILFIYPKDDTSGCTTEALGFSSRKSEFARHDATVVGLSVDDVSSHENFCDKHKLSVELLSDPEAKLLKELGLGQQEKNGTLYWNRTTLIVDEKGIIRFIFNDVNPNGHDLEVLSRLQKLQDENY